MSDEAFLLLRAIAYSLSIVEYEFDELRFWLSAYAPDEETALAFYPP